MGVYSWQYVGNQSQPKVVQLYHGEKSGHVLITLGKSVLVVDFKVRATKKYTFFIEDELCEVQITREAERFVYTFEINKTAQTPLNEQRRKTEKKHLLQTFAVFGGFFLFVAFFYFGFKKMKNTPLNPAKYGIATVAQIEQNEQKEWTYFFIADNQAYNGKLGGEIKTKLGIPLVSGDEFELKYSAKYPENHILDLDNPTATQIEKYIKRVSFAEAEWHKSQTLERANCLVELGVELVGLEALGHFYFQQKTEIENANFNKNSYQRLIRSVNFKKLEQRCLVY